MTHTPPHARTTHTIRVSLAYIENVEPEGVPVRVGADDALYDVERQGQDVAQQRQEVLGLVLDWQSQASQSSARG